MIEEILPDFYRIEIPLPRSPLKFLNSYLIKGQRRFLVIDTGMNRQECRHTMLTNLEKLKVNLQKTDFLITHLHADHIGLVGNLASEMSRVYFSKLEAEIVNADIRKLEKRSQRMNTFFFSHGFPADELEEAIHNHPGYKYIPKREIDFCILKEEDVIDIGDFSLRCIETPGHSPGHLCLYEKNKKILISGDHILFDITPNITCWPELGNALKRYLSSLEKVYDLDVDLVLPGHRSILDDHRGRIIELREHHQNRLDEALTALEGGEKNAWEIAPWISWDMDYSAWELFPAVQKWFAFGETIAHLDYLEADRKIAKKVVHGEISYTLA